MKKLLLLSLLAGLTTSCFGISITIWNTTDLKWKIGLKHAGGASFVKLKDGRNFSTRTQSTEIEAGETKSWDIKDGTYDGCILFVEPAQRKIGNIYVSPASLVGIKTINRDTTFEIRTISKKMHKYETVRK